MKEGTRVEYNRRGIANHRGVPDRSKPLDFYLHRKGVVQKYLGRLEVSMPETEVVLVSWADGEEAVCGTMFLQEVEG